MCDRIEITDDSQSRLKIETELDKNFFVEAGAGSGKTTELVNRMVAMVENGADISKICAITFTKAAAAEFYVRFQEGLAERAQDNAYCREALENIDLCFMGTIDSFCRMILTEHPMEAKIPADAKLLDENEMKLIYEKVYIDLRKGVYGEELKKKAELFKAYYWNDKDEFVYDLSFFMGQRNVHFNYDASLLGNIDIDARYARVREDLINILTTLSRYRGTYAYIPYGSTTSDPEWDNIDEFIAVLSKRWSTNIRQVNRVLATIHDHIEIKKIPAGVDPQYFDERRNPFNNYIDAYMFRGAFFEELRELKYAITMDLLISVAGEIEKNLRESGTLSHFDYLYLLRNMLREDAVTGGRLARHIYKRHSYFFLDEFQDTNPMQAEIFFYLCAQETRTDWRDCVPFPGSLFIVGDPKQSIYKFRSADIGSYHKVKNLFTREVGEILYLRKNFRSRKFMTEFFNAKFAMSFPDEDTEHQCTYTPIELQENRNNDESFIEGVYTYDAYTGPKLSAQYPEMADETRVAGIIKRIVHNENYKVLKSGETEPRMIEYDDIMVITYGKERLGNFIREFNDENIPVKTEGKVMFADCPGLVLVRDIMKVIADPYDVLAITTFLKGNMIGVSDKDILHFVTTYCDGRALSINSGEYNVPETDKAAGKIADNLTLLGRLYRDSAMLSPAATFMMIMEKIRLFTVADSNLLEVFYYTLELIRAGQAGGAIVTLSDCADYIEYLIDNKSEQERCLSLMNDTHRVHLANLHKVKGLEAPIVFLTYWYPQPPKAGVYVDYSGNDPEGYVLTLSESTGSTPKIHFSTNDYPEAKQKDVNALNAEKLRLIYVAATRARQVLFVCKSHSGRVGNVKSTWSGVITGFDTPPVALEQRPNRLVVQTHASRVANDLYDAAKDDSVLNDRETENHTYELKTPSGIKVGDKMSEEDAGEAEVSAADSVSDATSEMTAASVSKISEADRNTVKEYPNYLGTMVHKLMEMMVSASANMNSNKIVAQILEQYITKLLEPSRASFERVLLEIAEQMECGGYPQINGAPQNILETLKNADEVYCEVPFSYMKGDELWKGEMDVVYRSGDEWHIIDYKTNAEGSSLDEEYAGQLAEYQNAFKTITGNDADAHTYHIEV